MRLQSLLITFLLGVAIAAPGCVDAPWTASEGAGTVDEAHSPDSARDREGAFLPPESAPWSLPGPLERVQPDLPDVWVTDMHRAPLNIHLGLERDPHDSIVITWATSDVSLEEYVPRAWIAPAVEVDGEGDAARMPYADALVVEGAGTGYVEEMFGLEADEEPHVAWEVSVVGLQPDTEYVSRVGTWESVDPATGEFVAPNLSVARRFRTGPLPGSRDRLDFVLAGDSRGGTAAIAYNMDGYMDVPARAWFFNGDMTDTGTQLEWDQWLETMRPLMETRPFMPVQGNHEYDELLFYTQFAMPKHPDLPEDLREHGWSIRYGNVHFVGLDSNWSQTVKDMIPWLDADLAAARKDPAVDWIVVMTHHPPYSSAMHGSTWWMRASLIPTLEKHEVDLVFSGHDHFYERTHPIRQGRITEPGEGVTYVVAGAFYAPPYVVKGDWFTAASADGYKANFVTLTVEGELLTVTARSGDGSEVLDSFTRTR